MAKVTVIAYSKGLHNKNFAELRELAKRLGKIRAEVWRKYGSIQGVGLHHRTIRDEWMSNNRLFDVQARLWKETLRDTVYDIKTYREATKVIVRKAISERTKDNEERKRLYTLLKYDRWSCDNFLRRKMRKYFKHGITKVDNQIVLDPCCYTTFEHNGKAWLKVMGINRGKRITIPLNTNHTPQGMLRLILRDGKIEVHYARDVEEVCSIKAHGEKVIGIDKGYTEVFVDSEGNEHGDKLGELLTSESDFLKDKYRNRNKISAVRDAKLHKQRAIDLNNMGCKKIKCSEIQTHKKSER